MVAFLSAISQRFRKKEASSSSSAESGASYGATAVVVDGSANGIVVDEQSSLLALGNIQQQQMEAKPKRVAGQDRMIALDVMRGMTIMLMIVVNNQPSRTYYPLDHAEWFGMTPTDLVFPFFLWVSGYAAGIVFRNEWKSEDISFFPCSEFWHNIQNYFRKLCGKIDYENLEEGQQIEYVKYLYLIPMRRPLYEVVSKWTKIIRRSILLFLIGFFFSVLSHLFDFTNVRVMGVLQRIGICYFITSSMLVLIPWTFIQIVFALFLQVLYILITFGLYVPQSEGCATRGVLEPPQCTAEGYIDRLILTQRHTYQQANYDPEGFLSTLSAVTNCYVGVLAFKVAQKAGKDAHKRLNYWFLLGSGLMISGMLIHYAGLPIGKKLWTTSFAFVSSGIACAFLACICFIVDIHQYKKYWTAIFLWTGSNPLVMYVVPTLVAIVMLKIPVTYQGKQSNLYSAEFRVLFASWLPIELASTLHGICYELLFIPLAFLLYWRKIFIKL